MKNETLTKKLQTGIELHKEGKLEEAEQIYRSILSIENKNITALFYLASILSSFGKSKEARGYLIEAISINPTIFNIWLNLGINYIKDNCFNEAIEAFNSALKIKNEGSPDLWNHYAQALNTLNPTKYLDRVINCYLKSLNLNCQDSSTYFKLAESLIRKGSITEAVDCYKQSIRLNPSSNDSLNSLNRLYKEKGSFSPIVEGFYKKLSLKVSLDNNLNIDLTSKSLIFDWELRELIHEEWDSLFKIGIYSLTSNKDLYNILFDMHKALYPNLFNSKDNINLSSSDLILKGHIIEKDLVSKTICDDIIHSLKSEKDRRSEILYDKLFMNGLFSKILKSIYTLTGYKHIIWSCSFGVKSSENLSVSNSWHYDNHYNASTPKLIIYLNSQEELKGATDFVDSGISELISKSTGYMGFIFQRERYLDYVHNLIDSHHFDKNSYDPTFTRFSPVSAGEGIWFYPSKVLHRGINPIKDTRYVLSFSLTPLPKECDLNISDCIQHSILILNQINKGRTSDPIPFWLYHR